ncbi:MAG: T9SS type A sorting domain-containing protein [Bacteroidia bacterium]
MRLKFSLFITILLTFSISHARTCYSTGNGNWGTASTWTCSGGPAPGDTIFILAGHTVTVAATVSYHPSPNPMYIVIEGTLHFDNGKKLRLPCNSGVRTVGSGQITAVGYTGSSENIEICGTVVWRASDGPVTTPTSFGTPFSPLPVSLINFIALQKNNAILIKWSTSIEINNDFFTIEISKDGENFKAIKIIKGAGFSNEILEYSFLHEKPYSGINYYRLKQTDYDGTFTYSDIIAVNFKNIDSKLNVFPNPIFNQQFTLSGLAKDEVYSISICDLSGRIIKSIKTENVSEINISLEETSNGYYFVIVQSATNTDIFKISVN